MEPVGERALARRLREIRELSGWALGLAILAFIVAIVLGILGTIAFCRATPTMTSLSAQPIEWGLMSSPAADAYILPMDPSQNPSAFGLPGSRFFWTLPAAATLQRVHIAGDATRFSSVNSIVNINGTAIATPLDLWVNGAFSKHLGAVPAGLASFDVFTSANVALLSTDRYQYVFNISLSNGTGSIGNFQVSSSWVTAAASRAPVVSGALALLLAEALVSAP